MSAIKKILVPLDLSQASRAALRYVQQLAGQTAAAVHVLFVWELPEYLRPDTVIYQPGQPRRTMADIARAEVPRLREMIEEVAPELARVELLEFGDPERVILDLATAGRFDLIVLGAGPDESVGPRRRHLIERLSCMACCPVLAVPDTGPQPARGKTGDAARGSG